MDKGTHEAWSWLPVVFAVAAFLAFSVLSLAYPYKLREPDPYAYRASIKALASGHLTLDTNQFKELNTRLLVEGDGWPRLTLAKPAMPFTGKCGTRTLAGVSWLVDSSNFGLEGSNINKDVTSIISNNRVLDEPMPIGIAQWMQIPSGRWVSEKNIGFPFLMVLFDSLGLIRIAPFFYGILSLFCLWLGAARWLGRWGAAFTLSIFLCPGAMIIMGHRAYMPTFTHTAMLAAGAGLLLWTVLSTDATNRCRSLVGFIGFFILGTSVILRYTNVVPAAVIAAWTTIAVFSSRWRLDWRMIPPWILGALIPATLLILYNEWVFGKIVAFGYEGSRGAGKVWYISNLKYNICMMPIRLLSGIPTFIIAFFSLIVAITYSTLWLFQRRSCVSGICAGTMQKVQIMKDNENEDSQTENRLSIKSASGISHAYVSAWVIPMLFLWWLSVWGLYFFFGWTWSSIPQSGNIIISVRFYLPAAGAIALLSAWLLSRISKLVSIFLIISLFIINSFFYINTVTGDWLFSQQKSDSIKSLEYFKKGDKFHGTILNPNDYHSFF